MWMKRFAFGLNAVFLSTSLLQLFLDDGLAQVFNFTCHGQSSSDFLEKKIAAFKQS